MLKVNDSEYAWVKIFFWSTSASGFDYLLDITQACICSNNGVELEIQVLDLFIWKYSCSLFYIRTAYLQYKPTMGSWSQHLDISYS